MAILREVSISDYPSGVRFFFDKGRALVSNKNPDPAGYTEDVGAYINTTEKINAAVSRFDSAFERAVKAESAGRYGNIREALSSWRWLFGDYFPMYG